MPCAAAAAVVHGDGGGTIKVGTTGTIGSLMTRELDAIKAAPPPPAAAGNPRLRRHQGCPVSAPCGAATPRKTMLRKSASDISSTSRGDRVSAEDGCCKPRRVSRRNTFDSPMLRSDGALVDVRTPSAGRAKKKWGVCGYGVEVVDVRCGNPMTSRLRKLGFCKLSETFA